LVAAAGANHGRAAADAADDRFLGLGLLVVGQLF
jgi:hypothetical protein